MGGPGQSTEALDRLIADLRENGVSDDRAAAIEAGVASGRHTPAEAAHHAYDASQLTEDAYHRFLVDTLRFTRRSEVTAGQVDGRFVDCIPIGYARRYRMVGLKGDTGMVLATDDPHPLSVADHVAAWVRVPVMIELAPAGQVEAAINEAYASKESDFAKVLDVDAANDVFEELAGMEDGDLLDDEARAPVIKLVNMMFFEAVKRCASDVHVHPYPTHVQVRYRIDGVLYDYLEVPVKLLDEVVSRIKVIGRMDIAERRIAQDGRTTVTVGDRSIDLRISIIPTSCGERAVIRLLDKSARLYTLPELGMPPTDRVRFERIIEKPHGIILVTGPTGSGKSTTLYAALQYLDHTEKNILTLEDPIEYQLTGISQTQVSSKKGMTFATGLRAVLRQDPDVIMVGEIRDEETARMAVQSSLTGHLVFSTLHTNDAAGAVSRLLDLGIESYLVASSLLAVLAQRLVRTLCPDCGTRRTVGQDDILSLSLEAGLFGKTVLQASGCPSCTGTGYRGRVGVFELLTVDEAIRELIVKKAKSTALRARAIEAGMTTLRDHAVRRVLQHETTFEEISRVSYQDEMREGTLCEGVPEDGEGIETGAGDS